MTADRKRFGILAAGLLIGILLWARIIVISKAPRRAIADDAPPADERLQTLSAEDAESGSDRNGAQPIRIALADQMRRDPFEISTQHFPKPTISAKSHEDTPKSHRITTEDALRVEAQRSRELQAIAARFILEGTMARGQMAVIDGTTYRVGDIIQGNSRDIAEFRLIEVNARSVIIECEGRRFELRMNGSIGR